MEAKVDVRKLQVLNDRINQTIDALNQVRMSVHGLGHTGIQPPMVPFNYLPQSYGMQQPFGFGTGFPGIGQNLPGFSGQLGGFPGMSGMGQQSFSGITPSFGFQHTPFQHTPFKVGS